MAADRAVLRQAFAQQGSGLVLLGADPLRPAKRVNPGARYRAMEQFFTASDTGAAGAAMMTSTASVQVNVDAGPRDQWAARVRLAHALGPMMIAISANSPLLGGEFSGWRSTRQRVWSQLDSARCGPILGANGDDPADDWSRYALKAPVMLVHAPDAVPVTDWVPFADWADGTTLLGGRPPTEADVDYHLTTLFPPVRPRGFLEIRYLDSVPDDVWPAVVFTLVTLLDDPRRRRHRRRGHRVGGHRMGPRRARRSRRPTAAGGGDPVRRGRRGPRARSADRRHGGACWRRWSWAAVPPTTSPIGSWIGASHRPSTTWPTVRRDDT